MKRAQLSQHKIIWFAMIPILTGIIAMALLVRPDPGATINAHPPAFLNAE